MQMFWRPRIAGRFRRYWRTMRVWIVSVTLLVLTVLIGYEYSATLARFLSLLTAFSMAMVDSAIDWLVAHAENRLLIYADDFHHDHSTAYWHIATDFASYLTALITLIGVFLTLLVVGFGARQARLAVTTMRRSARQEQMRLLIDLDLKLVDNPDVMVLAMGLTGLDQATLARAKAHAFSHAFLNTLDTVFDYYFNIDKKSQSTHWPAWEAHLCRQLGINPEFRAIAREAIERNFYTADFEDELRRLITKIEKAPDAVRRSRPIQAASSVDDPSRRAPAMIRELCVQDGQTRQDLETLATFYHDVYEREFPDPNERESLENMCTYLQRKRTGWYGDNNYHVLVAEQDGRSVGLCVSDYSATANAGIIEFLVVTPDARGAGLGRRLLDYTQRLVEADAGKAHASLPVGIAAEMNDPFRTDLYADNYDPFDRAALWASWGFNRVDMPYVQPALSADQAPVDSLLLMFKPLHPPVATSVSGSIVTHLLHDYLVYAMRIEEPAKNVQFAGMAAYLERTPEVALEPLDEFVGRRPAILWRDIRDRRDPMFQEAMKLYLDTFRNKPNITTPASDFAAFIDELPTHDLRYHYHFWVLPSASGEAAEGFASFFTLRKAGFGGYVARRRGHSLHARTLRLARVALAAVEERMRRDNPQIQGWFIECESDAERPPAPYFVLLGFRAVALDYLQPPLPGDAYQFNRAKPLQLLYKQFGIGFGPPELSATDFLAAIADIFEVVYRVRSPTSSPYHRHLSKQLGAMQTATVPFHSAMRQQ